MSAKEDLEIGRGLLASFIPFIQRLIDERLAKKTIKTHARNLNILGHEIVERFNQNDKDKRDASPRELILHFVDDEGDPLLSFWDPSDITDYRRHLAVAKFSRHFGLRRLDLAWRNVRVRIPTKPATYSEPIRPLQVQRSMGWVPIPASRVR